MRPDMRKTHRELDAAVDRALSQQTLCERSRAGRAHLFALYEKLSGPMLAAAGAAAARRKKRPAKPAINAN
jgi:hypothetical protein